LVERRFFGVDTMPILTRERIARVTYAYDPLGREIRRAFYDTHDQPTLGTAGFASVARQFDARGNEIETAFFGFDGKLVQAGLGYAKVLYSYDTVGQETDARYFNAQDRQLAVDVVIAGVIPSTTAALLEFAPGDRIIDYDGRKPTSVKQFIDAVADASGHQLRRLVLRRGPDDLTFEVAAGKLGVNIKIVLSQAASAAPVGPSEQPIARSP
jgi:S1-C subfamily serine protease